MLQPFFPQQRQLEHRIEELLLRLYGKSMRNFEADRGAEKPNDILSTSQPRLDEGLQRSVDRVQACGPRPQVV